MQHYEEDEEHVEELVEEAEASEEEEAITKKQSVSSSSNQKPAKKNPTKKQAKRKISAKDIPSKKKPAQKKPAQKKPAKKRKIQDDSEDDPADDSEEDPEEYPEEDPEDDPEDDPADDVRGNLNQLSFRGNFLSSQVVNLISDNNVGSEDLMVVLDELERELSVVLESDNIIQSSQQFFGLRPEEPITIEFFRTSILAKYYHGVLFLHRLCRFHKMCGNDTEEQQQVNTKFTHFFNCLKVCTDLVLAHIRHQCVLRGDTTSIDLSSILENDKQLTSWQLVMEFLLKRIFEYRYRRYRACAYKEIQLVYCRTTDGEYFYTEYDKFLTRPNTDSSVIVSVYNSHAFNLECDLEKLIYKLIDRTVDYDVWLNFTSCGGAMGLAKYLEACCDPEFQDLVPDRTARAFFNGILVLGDIQNPCWLSYQSPEAIPVSLVCCKYFNAEFDTNMFNKHWLHIPTPYFDQILTDQEMLDPQKEIFYAMLGRCIHELGKNDNFQVLFFIKGVAQSGKSCIGHALKKFVRTEDVGILSSNMEEKFGLESIYQKLMFICFEVTKKFSLSRAEFQSIISGEEVSVSRKNKVAEPVKWNVPGIMFGNELGPWMDSAGSMIRRLLIAEFKKRITNINLELERMIESELPLLIHKCNQAYRELLTKAKNRSIWDTVPSFFRQVRKAVSENMNPIREFIFQSEKVYVVAGGQMEAHVFDSALRAWCGEVGYKNVRFTKEDYNDVFGEYNILEEDKQDVNDSGNTYHGKWYVGIRRMTDELKALHFEEQQRQADKDKSEQQKETDSFQQLVPSMCTNTKIQCIFEMIQSQTIGYSDYYQIDDFKMVNGTRQEEQVAQEEQNQNGGYYFSDSD